MTCSTRPAAGAVLAAAVLVTAELVASCGSSPGPTTAVPSEPTSTGFLPTPIVTPVPTAPGPDADVVITAQDIAFAEPSVTAPAGVPFTLGLVNKDPDVPHGIEIRDGAGRSVFRSDIVTGPSTAVFDVPALEAGTYTIVCPVHPNMTGVLVAGG